MNNKRIAFTVLISAFFFLVARDFYARYQFMLREPVTKWKASFFMIVFLTLALLTLALLSVWKPKFISTASRYRHHLGFARWLLAIAAGIAVNYFFIFVRQSEIFSGSFSKLMLYFACLAFMAWMATNHREKTITWQVLLSSATLFCGTFLLTDSMQKVVDYPFPLYWSEGNRIWDYSLMFGRRLYNYPVDRPIPALIDAGRQSLWGLPFLFPGVTIQGVRFWSAFVFTIPYCLLGWFIFKPEKGKMGLWFLLGLWTMLFLNQGPIYTPLVLAAILVAGGRKMPYLLNLLLVALAGYYTYHSRVTWIVAPALWAGVIALVEMKPINFWGKQMLELSRNNRWLRAAGLVFAGLMGGVIIPDILPRFLSPGAGSSVPDDAGVLSTEFIASAAERQPLLWERLLPNPTNPAGILPGLILATAPLIALMVLFAIRKGWKLDIWQKLAVFGSLLAFLIVGFVVSVKIGGGSNLHNLDMFLIGLIFTAGLAWEAGGADWLSSPDSLPGWVCTILLVAILLPVANGLMSVEPFYLPPEEIIEDALNHIQTQVEDGKTKGDVLFIDHRQLLTFGYVQDVPLVAEYEKKWMMDEAMANNADYFEQFNKDMANQRFSVIISELLSIKYQGDSYQFGNENDAWVRWVSTPVLCYYEIYETFEDVGAQILLPRSEPLDDPKVICPKP